MQEFFGSSAGAGLPSRVLAAVGGEEPEFLLVIIFLFTEMGVKGRDSECQAEMSSVPLRWGSWLNQKTEAPSQAVQVLLECVLGLCRKSRDS